MELKKAAKINPVLIWFLALFYKLYNLTLRKKIIFSEDFKNYLKTERPVLLAFWHEDVNNLLYISWKFKTMTMVSDSKDGQLVAQLIEALGSVTARGSSRTNPIKALKSFIRIMKKGEHWASIAVDGPKGPARKPKAGVLESAALFSCPIFTVSAAYSSPWVFKKTWDQTKLAKPFSRLTIYFGLGLEKVDKASLESRTELLASLEKNLSRNNQKALGYHSQKS